MIKFSINTRENKSLNYNMKTISLIVICQKG